MQGAPSSRVLHRSSVCSGDGVSYGDPAAVISWTVALIGCIAAPIAGFILRAYRMAGIGVLVALAPPLVALFLTSGVYHPTESVLKWRVRCRGCGARGRAVVSIKWGPITWAGETPPLRGAATPQQS